jgi:hypothetical protein
VEDLIMKMFDYSELIRVIDNVEIREEKERVMGVLKLKEKCNELEHSIIKSGILDDWNRLKHLCAKAKVRLCVSHLGNDSIGYVLGVSDFRYCNEYNDDGMIKMCMSSGSYWSDYYGFTYEADKGIVWKVTHNTSKCFFNGFSNDEEKYRTKIYLLETFKKTYEHYREFQLKKVEEKFENRIKAEDIIK